MLRNDPYSSQGIITPSANAPWHEFVCVSPQSTATSWHRGLACPAHFNKAKLVRQPLNRAWTLKPRPSPEYCYPALYPGNASCSCGCCRVAVRRLHVDMRKSVCRRACGRAVVWGSVGVCGCYFESFMICILRPAISLAKFLLFAPCGCIS